MARLLNQNFGWRSKLSLTEAGNDSAGVALDRFINDYSSQNDDEDSCESELIEEGSDDNGDLRFTGSACLSETDSAVTVVATDSSTATEIAKATAFS